ncbi:hypothetical protein AKJ61_00780 [candidate division MSBL1 archaeon SCGC-AAA259B11]|uniref:VWA-like domain-containing protein n=1 Tax=candidate division MSBL1 archaeon SCGC-AAA259B11 TaxID=1698260 RepID=A0A133U864_9EURY|nr:hypothetical protein AKJ61_00780 [candidate division MSBL1 archaeon SCGC-AAA259B11]
MDKKAKKKMETARCQLLIDWGTFGSLITYLEPVEAPNYRAIMGTDGEHIYYNPEIVKETDLDELVGVNAHEVLHAALGHIWRQEDRDDRKWSAAEDYVTNLLVKQQFSIPDYGLYDRKYEGMSVEEVYEELPDQPDQPPQCPQCGSENLRGEIVEKVGPNKYKVKVRCQDCGYEWETVGEIKEGNGSSEDGEGIPMDWRTIDDHDEWEEAEGQGSGGGQEETEGQEKTGGSGKEQDGKGTAETGEPGASPRDLEEEWKRRTARVAQSAKAQGELPAGLERLVKDLLYPRVSWRNQLRRYVTSMGKESADWKRPNRKFLKSGFYFPTLKSERLEVAFAVDTSGSISDDDLRDFMSEVKGALDSFPSYKVRLLACDAKVHTKVTAERSEDFDDFIDEIRGAGGTDFRPVFDELENEPVKALVYLTDGRGTFPDEIPHFDTLWVIDNRDVEPPWGKVIRLAA